MDAQSVKTSPFLTVKLCNRLNEKYTAPSKYLNRTNFRADKFSRFTRILPKFAKLNPREIFANSQIAKLNPREIFANSQIAKLNPREIFEKTKFAKLNPREIKKAK